MADFGEYLPLVLFSPVVSSVKSFINLWTVLWTQMYREVVEGTRVSETLSFGCVLALGVLHNYSVMSCAGDLIVDFSTAEGLASVIPVTLPLDMFRYGMNHFEMGVYMSIYGAIRTEELFALLTLLPLLQ
ncbi:hypothetical protein HOLleu_39413 [Holothuria leucospilota]|uniref:Uncharacterized protein n=1 Tax=Holothuria leucospilota TaxID=206669 RepID=A0A9Q1BE32_HOLLE|nr:hypothetical protein HOLleu_39413 [Holothuria leucospilota]